MPDFENSHDPRTEKNVNFITKINIFIIFCPLCGLLEQNYDSFFVVILVPKTANNLA